MQNLAAAEPTDHYHHHIGKHQLRRRCRRALLQDLLFLLVLFLMTFVVELIREFGGYNPKLDEPKDLDRELRLLKQRSGSK